MTDYKAAVDAGVDWLNANRPEWRGMIDRDTLCLTNTAHCVLGQTGGYDNALCAAIPDRGEIFHYDYWATWRERDEWADAHGFRVPNDPPSGNVETDYQALTEEWLTRL